MYFSSVLPCSSYSMANYPMQHTIPNRKHSCVHLLLSMLRTSTSVNVIHILEPHSNQWAGIPNQPICYTFYLYQIKTMAASPKSTNQPNRWPTTPSSCKSATRRQKIAITAFQAKCLLMCEFKGPNLTHLNSRVSIYLEEGQLVYKYIIFLTFKCNCKTVSCRTNYFW